MLGDGYSKKVREATWVGRVSIFLNPCAQLDAQLHTGLDLKVVSSLGDEYSVTKSLKRDYCYVKWWDGGLILLAEPRQRKTKAKTSFLLEAEPHHLPWVCAGVGSLWVTAPLQPKFCQGSPLRGMVCEGWGPNSASGTPLGGKSVGGECSLTNPCAWAPDQLGNKYHPLPSVWFGRPMRFWTRSDVPPGTSHWKGRGRTVPPPQKYFSRVSPLGWMSLLGCSQDFPGFLPSGHVCDWLTLTGSLTSGVIYPHLWGAEILPGVPLCLAEGWGWLEQSFWGVPTYCAWGEGGESVFQDSPRRLQSYCGGASHAHMYGQLGGWVWEHPIN